MFCLTYLLTRSVLPIVDPANHHYLLVTLLVYNAIAAESLPVLMAKLVPDVVAVIISVILILLIGEIVPTALFTGEHQLAITSYLIPLVYFLQIIFFPISYPLSKLNYYRSNPYSLTHPSCPLLTHSSVVSQVNY